jgi:hypothetical protein
MMSTPIAAVGLATGWTVLLAFFARRLVYNYFPVGDEWALIANSNPALMSPLAWFTSGFSNYFVYDPILSVPYANFIRPSTNLTYWLLGLVLSPTSKWRLCFTFAVIGACAGLTYACAVRSAAFQRKGLALALAATVPLLPAFAPSLIFLAPYNVFDALAAALCLLAYLAFESDRYWTTLALLTLAVFTKETALPVAVAVPVVAFLCDRRRARADFGFALRIGGLWLPALAWIACRYLAFGSTTSGTYAFGGGMRATLATAATMAWHWPLPSGPWGSPWFHSVLPGVINATLILGCIGVGAYRAWRKIDVDLAEVCALFSYAALLVVGISPRYGAVFEVFLVVSIVRAYQARLSSAVTAALVVSLTACAAIASYRTWRSYPATEGLMLNYYRIAQRYVKALDRYGSGDTVLVLNDPITWHSRVQWLSAVEGNKAEVVKAMDFACPTTAERLRSPCEVSLRPGESPRRFEFEESCGLEFCGTMVAAAAPVRLHPAAGISIDLRRDPDRAANPLVWHGMTVDVDRPGVQILYFDPATRDFRGVSVQ